MVLLAVGLSACSSNQTRLPPQDIAAASKPVSQEKTIALLGGTGMVGGYILREALAQGYPLRILTRSPGKLDYLGNRVTVIQGDARNPRVVEKLLAGSDVVVTAIGPRTRQDSVDHLNTTVSKLVARTLQGQERYIVVSGAAVKLPDDSRNFRGWLMRQGIRLSRPTLLRDRQAEYDVLANSDLDWTLVRCPIIQASNYQDDPKTSSGSPTSFHLRAGELARFIIGLIDDEQYVQQGPVLNSH